jgi:hypothetical protein
MTRTEFSTALTVWAEKRLGLPPATVTKVAISHVPGWAYSSETWDEASTTITVDVDDAMVAEFELYSGDLIRELASVTEDEIDAQRRAFDEEETP